MKLSTEHISSQLQNLVEGSEDQLPFNNFYTYQGIKELYQRLANDEKFMEDPIWAMGQQGMPPMPMMPSPMGLGNMT